MANPFIERIQVEGFLSFPPGSGPIELRCLNVIVGPNGSGKSNLVEAFAFLRRLNHRGVFQAVLETPGPIESWLWRGSGPASISVVLNRDEGRRLEYSIEWAPSNHSDLLSFAEIHAEKLVELPSGQHLGMTYFRRVGRHADLAVMRIDAGGSTHYRTETDVLLAADSSMLYQRSSPDLHPDACWLGNRFAAMEFFRNWVSGPASCARGPQTSSMSSAYYMDGGLNLGSLVRDASLRGALDTMNARLREFIPHVHGVSVRRVNGGSDVFLSEGPNGASIPTSRMSDGTLRFMAMALLLLSEPAPPLILIEEPEIGLHPDALSVVARMLVEASQRTQIVITTHSDALLAALTGHEESVLVCSNLGGTELRRLDPGYLRHLLDDCTLGDLWRSGHI